MVLKLGKKNPKQERSKLTVDAIIEAASRILDKDGLVGLTTNKIAEVAGISVGSLYQYFKNKEGIFEAILVRMTEENLKTFETQIASIEGEVDIKKIIKVVVQGQYDNLEKLSQVYSILFEYAPQVLSPSHFRKADKKIISFLIETMNKNGIQIAPQDNEMAFFICSQTVRSVLYMIFLQKKKEERQKIVDELVEMLSKYLQR